MSFYYLSLGSNLGNRLCNLQTAIKKLNAAPGIKINKVSAVYVSKAAGMSETNCPDFFNLVCLLESSLSPAAMLLEINSLEQKFGRLREDTKVLSRTLDIDILYLLEGNSSSLIKNANLQIPHPAIFQRDFVILPLLEIAHRHHYEALNVLELNRNLTSMEVMQKNVLQKFGSTF